MIVWLLKDGEALPVESGVRRMRMGMLAHALADRGHEVHWISSTFLHQKKLLYAADDQRITVNASLTLHLLYAGRFKKNLSLQRYLFYRRYARRVQTYCPTLPRPDIIVCAFPLIDVAAWTVDYARRENIPVLVDVRDLWPDTILELFPKCLRFSGRLLLHQDFAKTRSVFSRANRLCAMSRGVLGWAQNCAARSDTSLDFVLPIGFPSEERFAQPALLPQTLAHLKGKHLFVYVGSFGYTYNLNSIIQAARQLDAHGRCDIHFVLAGQGPSYESISREATGAQNVTLMGWLEHADVRTLMRVARAGLLPWAGLKDALPNKFFEYVSAGLPVISSADGELNVDLERRGAGLVYAPDDPSALVAAVMRLANDDTFAVSAARAAANWFDQEFAESSVYARFAEKIEGMAASL